MKKNPKYRSENKRAEIIGHLREWWTSRPFAGTIYTSSRWAWWFKRKTHKLERQQRKQEIERIKEEEELL